MRRRHRHLARIEIGAVGAAVGQLYSRQRAIGMNGVRHLDEARHVVLIPDAQFDERRDLGCVVDFHLLGKDDAPAAFRFHPPHFGRSGRIAIASTVAMRHLVEAVLGGDRPDPHRLEQDIVTRIAP